MKKSLLLLALISLSLLCQAQVYQVLWSNGKAVYTIPADDFDSVSYEFAENIDVQYHIPNMFYQKHHINTYNPNAQTFTVNGVSFAMVGVEGGTFTMGDDNNTRHQVTLSDYSIGETEVTQELWVAVMGHNPSYFSGSKHPVDQVSWSDCQTFITRLNQLTGKQFRLPTEAEWEYAARGGKHSKGYKYSGSNILCSVGWARPSSGLETHTVRLKFPNELGLYDMSGNVWEWCQDWHEDYTNVPQTNPIGPAKGTNRLIRGGAFDNYKAGTVYEATECYPSFRNPQVPSLVYRTVGLRLVLSEFPASQNRSYTVSQDHYEYVDLGLSVKWATYNVGAEKPEEGGEFFAWGEILPKAEYHNHTYKWREHGQYTKYTSNDGKITLDIIDDAAAMNWGGKWRMPTDAEITELRENCTWEFVSSNFKCGYKVTSKKPGYTNRSIFIPLAGYMHGAQHYGLCAHTIYWSSTYFDNAGAYGLCLSTGNRVNRNAYSKLHGFLVRPVCP